ncbi:ATP-binding protein [Burkholderia pseudomallei]
MANSSFAHAVARVFYRPIEAAIRWSDLEESEFHILETIGDKSRFGADDFPQWPHLHLNNERIYDAIANRELPYGRLGITVPYGNVVKDAELTVRHTDLKRWMMRFYPDQKPPFLFDPVERMLHGGISVRTLQILHADREALKTQLETCSSAYQRLHDEHAAIKRQHERLVAQLRTDLSDRSEHTYLNIIGGLINLMLAQSPAGHPYSVFQTQESVISAMNAHFGGRLGITKRTLESKFAAARRSLDIV